MFVLLESGASAIPRPEAWAQAVRHVKSTLECPDCVERSLCQEEGFGHYFCGICFECQAPLHHGDHSLCRRMKIS